MGESLVSFQCHANWCIETLFCWPCFWKSDKICNFIRDVSELKLKLPADTSRWLKPDESNWKDVLRNVSYKRESEDSNMYTLIGYNEFKQISGNTSNSIQSKTTHLAILTHNYIGMNDKKIRAISKESDFDETPMSLLRLMRHKYTHFLDMPPMFQKALGWAEGQIREDGKWNRDDKKFAKYWTTHFPNLLPYLWLQFYKIVQEASTLDKFYPDFLKANKTKFEEDRMHWPIDTNDVAADLTKTLNSDLEKGEVTSRFMAGQIVLEFRTMNKDNLKKILDEEEILLAEFSSSGLHCLRYSKSGKRIYLLEENKVGITNWKERNSVILIICNSNIFSYISKILAKKKVTQSNAKKIIVYLVELKTFMIEWQKNKKAAKQYVMICQKFEEKPLQLQDLRKLIRLRILLQGRFQIQTKVVKLRSLLPMFTIGYQHILSSLNGDLLNQLLKRETTILAHALQIRKPSEVHISRKIFFKESDINVRRNSCTLVESDFLSHVRSCWKSRNTFVIAGKSGNGKSNFLERLAVKSSEDFQNYFTIYLNMSDLVAKVGSKNVSRESIVDALCSMVGNVSFKQNLYSYWLQSCDKETKFRFELFVDAFDQVDTNSIDKALQILKHVINFSCAAVCFTLRDNVLEEHQRHFENADIYQLEPFSSKNQINFLVQYWQKKSGIEMTKTIFDHLNNFAAKCIKLGPPKLSLELAGTPLVCKILAEVYEREALSHNSKNPSNYASLCNLYDKIWDQKIEIWLEKWNLMSKRGKKNSVVNFTFREMQNWHIYLAIQMLFGEEVANKFKLCFFTLKETMTKMRSLVLQQGLVTSLNPVTFVHQSIAEEFVARFILAVFEDEVISLSVDSSDFEHFLSYQVLATESSCDSYPVFKHQTLCYLLNARSRRQKGDLPLDSLLSLVKGKDGDNGQQNICVLSIYAACRENYSNLLTILLKSPLHLLGFFEIAIKLDDTKFCRLVIEKRTPTFQDIVVLRRYCLLNSLSSCNLETWFSQKISQFLHKI